MKIAILGGGLSGIILTKILQSKGYDCHLFEANYELGGLCRSKIKDGFVFDLGGGHILHSKNTDVMQYMVNSTGIENWNQKIRNTKILFKGNYIKYPFENGLSDLPKQENYECLLGYVNSHFKRTYEKITPPTNFSDWIYYKFGDGIAQHFMIPYNQKIWNYSLSEINTSWIEGRVPSAPIEDVIKSSIGIDTEGYQHQINFYYPRQNGFQTLTNQLALGLKNIHLNTPITSLQKSDDQWIINNEYNFNDVISTLSLHDIPDILYQIPDSIKEATQKILYNGVATFIIGMNTQLQNNYSWIYLPHEEQGPVNRLTFLSNYSEFNAPENCSSILAEVTFKAGDSPKCLDKLANEVILSLHNINLLDKDSVITYDSNFFKYAYPVYGINHNENIQLIDNYYNEIKLKRFGRFATHSYYNTDHIVELAFKFIDKWYQHD